MVPYRKTLKIPVNNNKISQNVITFCQQRKSKMVLRDDSDGNDCFTASVNNKLLVAALFALQFEKNYSQTLSIGYY